VILQDSKESPPTTSKVSLHYSIVSLYASGVGFYASGVSFYDSRMRLYASTVSLYDSRVIYLNGEPYAFDNYNQRSGPGDKVHV
jgi:hypothetical protein